MVRNFVWLLCFFYNKPIPKATTMLLREYRDWGELITPKHSLDLSYANDIINTLENKMEMIL